MRASRDTTSLPSQPQPRAAHGAQSQVLKVPLVLDRRINPPTPRLSEVEVERLRTSAEPPIAEHRECHSI